MLNKNFSSSAHLLKTEMSVFVMLILPNCYTGVYSLVVKMCPILK